MGASVPCKLVVALFMVVVAIQSSCSREPLSQAEKDLITHCMKLDHPYTVTRMNTLDDGGSIMGQIEGAKGNAIGFWWDGRGRIAGDTHAPRCVYVAVDRDTPAGGIRLEVGSECETAFILALRDFADHLLPRSAQDSLGAIARDLRIPERKRNMATRHLTQAEGMALRASNLAGFLERQRSRPLGSVP